MEQKFDDSANFLVDSGLMDGYEYCLRSLCKNGLPKDKVFEFLAMKIEKFEEKYKEN